LWTGTEEVPLAIVGVWDGITTRPVSFDSIA
jgi:hypothetical protein